jgi:putative hydrolase of the HAD superfamily
MTINIIGIDADDTLWHNETIFRLTHKRFNELLGEFADEEALEAKLAAVERENMTTYGYGAKGFTLSMLQTAHGGLRRQCLAQGPEARFSTPAVR